MDPFNCSQIRKRKCHLQYVQHGTKQELWNNTPNDVRQTESIDSFKRELKSFYFKRFFNVFDSDNFRTFKMICPKCRRVNTVTACTIVKQPI